MNLSVSDVKSGASSVVFKPDIKQKGNYSVTVYTPGCLQDNSCGSRGIANVTGIFTENAKPIPPQQIFQTNYYDKYDPIYSGPVDINSDSFRPSVTLTPYTQQDNGILLVAQRVRFENITNSTGGLNGLFEFDPIHKDLETDFSKSAIDQAGIELESGAVVTVLAVIGGVSYVGGNLSDTIKGLKNIFSITDGNATALQNGGLNAQVSALQAFGNLLYVGGNFTDTVNGSVAGLNNLAAYDTAANSWLALGSGVRGQVNTIVPVELNVTESQPETCITINGNFDQLEAFGSSPAVAVQGFGVWVPSRQNWLQNLDLTTRTIMGQLSTATNVTGSNSLLAGTISSQGVPGAQDAVSLTSSPLQLNSLGVKIQPQRVTTSLHKRAVSGQNVTGAVTGLFYSSGKLNVTIVGGHFTATASNGSTINNLAFINGTGTVSGPGIGLDDASIFQALDTQDNLLYAGGVISGKVGDAGVNGLILYDLEQGNYAFPQPPALGGDNVAVNAITTRPKSTSVYVAGNFETAGSLACPSMCIFEKGQWNPPGSGIGGSVTALTWQGNDKLLVGGNLTINNNATTLANYDAKKGQWTPLDGAATALPGPVTALTAANDDVSKFWVAGQGSNGSAFLFKYNGEKFQPAGNTSVLGNQTTIRGLSMLSLNTNHDKTLLVPANMVLLITGSLDLPNFGNASAALFDGTTFTPFILSTSGNSPGSLSQLISEKTFNFKSPGKVTPVDPQASGVKLIFVQVAEWPSAL